MDNEPNLLEQLNKLKETMPKFSENLSKLTPAISPIQAANFDTTSFMKCDTDCEMLNICKEAGCTYDACYKGGSIVGRCKAANKQAIMQQLQLSKLQRSLIELQNQMLDNQKVKDKEHQNELIEQNNSAKKNRIFNWVTFGITTVLTFIVLAFTVMGYFKS